MVLGIKLTLCSLTVRGNTPQTVSVSTRCLLGSLAPRGPSVPNQTSRAHFHSQLRRLVVDCSVFPLVQHISPSLLQFGGFFWLDTWLLVDEQTNFTHFLKSSLSVWLSASAFFKKVTTSILFFYFLLEAKAFLQITFTFSSFISFFLFPFYLLQKILVHVF